MMNTHKKETERQTCFSAGPKGWKRLIRGFFVILIALLGLWSIIATGSGGSSGGSSSTSGTVTGSAA